jgi:P-type E1-E2 ATPase
MTVVSTIALLIEKDKYELHLEDPSINFVRIFYFFVLYAPFLPISLYGVYDLVVLIRRVSVQRDMNKTNKDSVKVMDPNTLPVLGQVDYCLLDKTGTLTTSQYKIKSIFIFNKRDYADSEPVSYRMYRIDEKVINEEFPNYSQNRAKRLETIAPGMEHRA